MAKGPDEKIWLSKRTKSGPCSTENDEDGYFCLPVEPLPQSIQLYCPLCSTLLLTPYQVTCCGKNFCLECLNDSSENKKPCIHCSANSFTSYVNTELRSDIRNLMVHCPRSAQGCRWIGTLCGVDQHYNPSSKTSTCTLEPPCTYSSKAKTSHVECPQCLQLTPSKQIQSHMETVCVKRPFTCQNCNAYKSTFEDVIQNHKPKCKFCPRTCPSNCGENVLSLDLEAHVQNDCPKTKLWCEFRELGCRATLKRKEYPEHVQNSSIYHLNLVVKKMNMMMQTEADMITELAKLKEQNRQLAKKLDTLLEQSKSHIPSNDHSTIEDTQAQSTVSSAGPYIKVETIIAEFTMKNFMKQKRENTIWSSPPFYTTQKGHRMFLQVVANGHGKYKGKFTSIFMHRTMGEFDDQITEPFCGNIAVELVSSKLKGANHRVVVSLEDEMAALYVNTVSGSYEHSRVKIAIPDYIHLSELPPKFLDKDTLVFRIIRLNN